MTAICCRVDNSLSIRDACRATMKNEDKIESCRRAAPRVAHAAFLLLFLACGAAHAFTIAPYFPLSIYAEWIYQINDASGTTTVERIVDSPGYVNGDVMIVRDSTGEMYFY